RDRNVTGVQTCALPISPFGGPPGAASPGRRVQPPLQRDRAAGAGGAVAAAGAGPRGVPGERRRSATRTLAARSRAGRRSHRRGRSEERRVGEGGGRRGG